MVFGVWTCSKSGNNECLKNKPQKASSYLSWQWQTWPSSERWFVFVEKQQSSSSPSCCPCPPRERSKGPRLSSWTPSHPAQCAEDLTAEMRRHFTLKELWHHLQETNLCWVFRALMDRNCPWVCLSRIDETCSTNRRQQVQHMTFSNSCSIWNVIKGSILVRTV